MVCCGFSNGAPADEISQQIEEAEREALQAAACVLMLNDSAAAQSEVRSVRRLKVYAWLAPQRRLHDDVVEVSVRLKTHSHGWVLCNRRRAWISFA